jgi:hypothetical protein
MKSSVGAGWNDFAADFSAGQTTSSEKGGSRNLKYLAEMFGAQAVGAFALYAAISLLVFGRGVIAHLSTAYLGRGPDPQLYIWFQAWWAYAISHHLNPFVTRAIWAPSGVNLGWATDFPLATVLLYPVTRLYGPIVACNALHLIAPPLAGWSVFVLYRSLVRRFWPAWIGGCVFAFSPYMLCAMVDSIYLALVFPLPIVIWAALRYMRAEMNAPHFVITLVALLTAQFLMSPEIYASAALMAAIAVSLAYRMASIKEKPNWVSLGGCIILSYGLNAILLSPYLYYMFVLGMPRGVFFSPWLFSIDLLNLFVPTLTNELGTIGILGRITSQFRNVLHESGGYIGLPLIAILLLFVRARGDDRVSRWMLWMLICAYVLALGPILEVAGYRLLPLPGAALALVPLFDKAMPARFMLYAYLIIGAIVAIWFDEARHRYGSGRIASWALGLAIVPCMCPNLSISFWTTQADIPSFFSNDTFRQYLARNENVMILPFGLFGEGMLWQATTKMYFNLAGGWGFEPPVPEEQSHWPIMAGLYGIAGVPNADIQLKSYLANHNVTTVIVGPRTQYLMLRLDGRRTAATWLLWKTLENEQKMTAQLLASLNSDPVKVGDITIYRIPGPVLAPYRQVTALDMQTLAMNARFRALLIGAECYLAQGRDPKDLTPQVLEQAMLVPLNWYGGNPFPDHSHIGNPVFHAESILRLRNTHIEVGLEGTYAAVKPLIDNYGSQARAVYFPYPHPVAPRAIPDNDIAMFVMEFDRAGLARAAAIAESNERTPAKSFDAGLTASAFSCRDNARK